MRPGAGALTMASMPLANEDIEDIPVLVVGAGPAGLGAAIELARHEVPALVVERRTVLSSHPRATVLSLRSMELMRMWGLQAEVRERSVDVDMRMLQAETLADVAAGSAVAVGYPSREQSRVLSPVEPACVAQDDVESLLLAHLRDQSSARVEFGSELTGVWTGPDGARAALRDVRTGAARTVQARYVVAADGARSAVRHTLGVPLRGTDDVMAGFTTLFRAPLWDVVGPHRHLLYFVTNSESPSAFYPAGPSDRWLAGLRTEGAEAFGERRIAELIRLGAGVPGLPVRIERSGGFSAAVQLAQRFRCGPVFLAGDAAHQVTPRGGTGLNLALHDGFDLGWKLAWVLREWATPALLDTYEDERRPVAEHTAARSVDPSGSIRAPEQEVHADLGGRIPHVWADEHSTLDLLGTGLTLLAGRDGPAWDAAAASLTTRVPVDVRLLDAVAARAVGAAGRSALLVRPDGKPAAVLPAGREPAPALHAAVAAIAA
jgi:2-polyprenyl-6-methoxyphenol hydroxylase-like FAD-dependent oxidoreductase